MNHGCRRKYLIIGFFFVNFRDILSKRAKKRKFFNVVFCWSMPYSSLSMLIDDSFKISTTNVECCSKKRYI